MKNIIRSSIKTPCPVCNRTKDGDCSQYLDGLTVMCKTHVDGTGYDEKKWHYNGTNKLGFQGTFVLKEDKEFVKPIRPKSNKYYYYPNRDGSLLVRVERIDYGNGKKKDFYQCHWNGSKWVNGNPGRIKPLTAIYRYAEVRQAVQNKELVFVVEGEATADALWELGIASTTTIGGSGSYSNYGEYIEDLRRARLVLSPDRDALGLEYISNFQRDFSSQIEGWYLSGTVGLWKNPAGGMDIGDDISDRQLTKEQILAKVITSKDYQQLLSPSEQAQIIECDSELARDLADSLSLRTSRAPSLFCGELGELLEVTASNFNIPSELFTFCLLPILASQIPAKAELMINPGTNYRVPALRWCGLVGETGAKKSPILDTLVRPIDAIQGDLAEKYVNAKAEYDKEYRRIKGQKPSQREEEPEPPTEMRDTYFSNFTMESIAPSLHRHPDSGSMVFVDELAGFFKSMDAYRAGAGGDRQKWLSIWNGGSLKVNRSQSSTIFIPKTSISILGGIQPSTIEKLIKDDDSAEDGLWNRFTFARLQSSRTSAFTETPTSLADCLLRIYQSLASQNKSQNYLSPESKPLWASWHDEIETRTHDEHNSLKRGTFAKIEGIAGRNALIIHRTLAAISGITLNQAISAEVMEMAIAWTKWELNQTLMEYQRLGLTDDPELSRILKFIDKFEGKGWINARITTRWWSGTVKPTSTEIRSFMAKVVGLGHAIDNHESIDSSQYQIQVTRNLSDFSDKSDETYTSKESRLSLSLVTDLNQENSKSLPDKSLMLVTKVGTSFSDKSENGNAVTKISSDKSESGNVVTKVGTKSSDKLEMLVDGNSSDTVTSFGTKLSDSIKPLPDNSFRCSVTKVTKISSNKILKIGDRARYVGNNKSLLKQYVGELIILEFNSLQDEATCLKPTGSLTSWVKFEDLEIF